VSEERYFELPRDTSPRFLSVRFVSDVKNVFTSQSDPRGILEMSVP
jgi:hypothetical protein